MLTLIIVKPISSRAWERLGDVLGRLGHVFQRLGYGGVGPVEAYVLETALGQLRRNVSFLLCFFL